MPIANVARDATLNAAFSLLSSEISIRGYMFQRQ